MLSKKIIFLLFAGLVFSSTTIAEPLLITTMTEEMKRFQRASQNQELPPYYVSYEITETDELAISSSFGSILTQEHQKQANLDIDLRVGDYRFDNTHPLRNNSFFGNFRQSFTSLVPSDYSPTSLRNRIWNLTEQAYRKVTKDYLAAKANDTIQAAAEDSSADFSKSTKVIEFEAIDKDQFDMKLWVKRIKKITAPFKLQTKIYRADAKLNTRNEVRWFVNSEGTKIQHFQKSYYLSLMVVSRAEDGMEIPRHKTFYTSDLSNFPSDEELLVVVKNMLKEVNELREAPILKAYTGPAIFSGQASGVLFHEVLGHRVEAQRMKNASDNKTFKHKLNKKILNEDISIISDPTLSSFKKIELNGHYRYDNQGVKAQPVDIVKDGVLKNFLLSRTLVDGFSRSNGHGRKSVGNNASARQSNLIIKTSHPQTDQQLKQKLIAQIKLQKLDYGLYFDDVVGGFTYTSWGRANSFNVIPIRVYKIFPDGREELHRGVDIIGTPLATLEEIKAVGDHYSIFRGYCGAESGLVPASLASPPIYLSKIEIQRKAKSFDRPPILEPVLDNKEFTPQETGL